MKSKPGDKVKVITEKKEHVGILMPNEESSNIFIKLDSGYNIGIKKSQVRKIEVIESFKQPKSSSPKPAKADKSKPTIAILHTGGTIASKVDYKTGGVVARFAPEELIAMFPELGAIANITSSLVSNMFSEDMRFKHYTVMAKAIEKEVKNGVDGIILTHGTDTMHYTSAALAFMLENLPIPVIMVGAQRSSDRGSSDAASNIIAAAKFIASTDFAGVAICMHKNTNDKICSILPACKTRKLHASRRDAFKAVNACPIAEIDYETGKILHIEKHYPKKSSNKLVVRPDIEEKVALLKSHPNMQPEQFKLFQDKKYKGLVLEGTGLGHVPAGAPNELAKPNLKNLKAISDLVKSGCVVVMTSQALFGRIQMNVYSTGRDILKAGVIPGEDMLPETAFIKLAWLLSNYKKEEVKKLIMQNLRGELTERSLYEEDVV